MEMTVTDGLEGSTLVELDGRFDILGAQKVDSRFTDLAESAKALVVDVSKVPFIASLGVRTLMVSAKTLMRRGAYMAVCGASDGVEAVLRSTGFDELVGLHPDVASAIASYKRREAAFANRKA
jgi:anti-sigma B factor antagonist